MDGTRYDVIVVGARCAGSPTAMLLARRGYRVLVVDKARFPSDTISTHLIHPPGVLAMQRWGVLDQLVSNRTDPIRTYLFDFGAFRIEGSPAIAGSPVSYAPRRTALDHVLVEAAGAAGAEVREGFTVEDVVMENGRVTGIRGHGRDGRTVTEHARVVVGADGRRSLVAQVVRPEQYHERPPLLAGYYTYFSGLPMAGKMETYVMPNRGAAAWPTDDGLTLVVAGWPHAEFAANKTDVEGNFFRTLAMIPSFPDRLAKAHQEERFVGTEVPNYFRKPYGPGWALVGDAGYNKDFITAQGIQDAFRDAELCTDALDQAFSGVRTFEEAMAAYQARRDSEVLAMYEFTCGLATLEPPPPELQELFAATSRNQEARDEFVRMNAGAMSPSEFFAPEHAGHILAGAGA